MKHKLCANNLVADQKHVCWDLQVYEDPDKEKNSENPLPCKYNKAWYDLVGREFSIFHENNDVKESTLCDEQCNCQDSCRETTSHN